MDSFLFALNAVAPIILMVGLGYFLKKIGFMNQTLSKAVNKLVFHLFLPVMIFLNVYKIDNFKVIDFHYILYVLAALLVIFGLVVFIVMTGCKKQERRGVLMQAAIHSNYALIGIPLARSLFGEEGEMIATLLSAVVVPVFSILSVIGLSMFSDGGRKPSLKKIFMNILKNPLIHGVVVGALALGIRAVFVQSGVSLRLTDVKPVYTVLGYLSNLATPLALLALGAEFEFSAVASLRREIILGTLLRAVLVPLLGIGTAYLFFASRFSGAHFAAFVAAFATPVAVSSVPMTQELGGDLTLAGQLVIWTTILSALTVFLASFLLRFAGIF